MWGSESSRSGPDSPQDVIGQIVPSFHDDSNFPLPFWFYYAALVFFRLADSIIGLVGQWKMDNPSQLGGNLNCTTARK